MMETQGMDALIPTIVWLLGMVICVIIAKKRNVTPTLFWRLLVVVLGPLAIPLVLLARPDKRDPDKST